MFKKLLVLFLVLSLIGAMFLTGCGNDEPTTAPEEDETTEEATDESKDEPEEEVEEDKGPDNPALARGNILTVADADFDGVFNPILSSSVYDSNIVAIIFDSLVTNDSKGNPIPELAEKWDISEDGKTYTFHLRKGVKFHDGHELTAEDVQFTYEMIAHDDYDGPRWNAIGDLVGAQDCRDGNTEHIEGIKIIDDYTISFTVSEVNAAKIINDFGYGIMPKHIYDFDQYSEFVGHNQNPIGSGPFCFKRYKVGQYVEVEANEDYWDGRPKLDGIIVKYTPRDSLAAEAQAGLADITHLPATPEDVEIATETGIIEAKNHPGNAYGYAGINLRRPKFQDKRVRKALAYALNRKAHVDAYFKGYARVCNCPVSPVSWAYPDESKLEKYEYNPEKAKELLKEAGWEDRDGDGWIENENGEKFTINWTAYTDSQYEQQLMAIMKENYKQIGIDVEIEMMEFNAVCDKVYTQRDFDVYNMMWSLSIDPDPTGIFDKASDVPGGYNSIGYYNEEAEQIFADGIKETNMEKRKKLYQRWAEIANDELPYIFLDISDEIWGANIRVKNFEPSAYYDWTYQVTDIEVEY